MYRVGVGNNEKNILSVNFAFQVIPGIGLMVGRSVGTRINFWILSEVGKPSAHNLNITQSKLISRSPEGVLTYP